LLQLKQRKIFATDIYLILKNENRNNRKWTLDIGWCPRLEIPVKLTNIYWNAGKSILLYPKTQDYPEKFGAFHKGRENENACKLGFVNVLDETGKLDYGIGKIILDKLN